MSDPNVSRVIDAIDRVELRVQDLDSAVDFYSQIVGLQLIGKDEGTASLAEPGGHVVITLDSNGVNGPADPNAAGLFHTAIRFPTRPSLGRALRRLAEAGLEIGSADHGVSEALYINDPSGNGVELYWDRPRDEWPPPGPGERVGMFSKPLDLHGLLEAGNDDGESAAAAPSDTDIGHVHLSASDLDATTSFYENVLGLDLVTSLWQQASFLSAQGYHHHIGANVWRSNGRPPARSDQAGITRIVFTVGDPDELNRLQRRLEEAGAGPRTDDDSVVVADPNQVELVFRKTSASP
jgi:catechol 2,3-dioxygenase